MNIATSKHIIEPATLGSACGYLIAQFARRMQTFPEAFAVRSATAPRSAQLVLWTTSTMVRSLDIVSITCIRLRLMPNIHGKEVGTGKMLEPQCYSLSLHDQRMGLRVCRILPLRRNTVS